MSTAHVLLGIDLGTSSVKTIVVDLTGTILANETKEYPILRPKPGYAEQSPYDWWRAICDAVGGMLSKVGSVDIAAIGLSGQMHGAVMVDTAGKPIAPAVIWPDQRSASEVTAITTELSLERLTAIAGSPVATGFQAATVRWMKQHEPELWQRVDKVLLPKDYVRFRLTGGFATDPSDGSGALLLDVRMRNWSPTLLAAASLVESQLPPVLPSTTVAGKLTDDAARALGLATGIPVVVGAADTACSALGAGATAPGGMLLTLSSGGQLVAPIGHVQTDDKGRIHTFCSAMEPATGPGWYQMGAMLAAGLALRWLRDQVLDMKSEDAYEQLSNWAADSTAGAHGLLFLPYLTGERTPHLDPLARGAFIGLTAGHLRGDLVRAVMEGVAMACYDGFQVLAEMGSQPNSIILAGGGGKSPVWRQIIADVFGLPVKPLLNSEQSAVGAVLLAGAGIGVFDLVETAQKWAHYGEPVLPDHGRHAQYEALFGLFQMAYRQNAELFHQLHAWS